MLIDVQVPGYLIQVVDRVGAVAVVRVGQVMPEGGKTVGG